MAEKIKFGVVGCGGRGTQAIIDHLTGNPQSELVAMADVFEDKLEGSLKRLRESERAAKVRDRVKVAPDHRFMGFDAFQRILKSDVDVIFLTTPPGYRPEHFEAAVNAGKHCFVEKPIATDPVGARRFLAAAEKAKEKKLTVVSGAQRRAERAYVETYEKVRNGAIGDIVAGYAMYLSGPVMHANARDEKWGDMEWQHRNWYSFLWICGDQIVEQHFHNIDTMNWFLGSHPVKARAYGGAAWRPRTELYGNIYDHLSTEFVYPNGVIVSSVCRQYPNGTYRRVWDELVGSKGKTNCMDMGEKGENPYVQEHINLVKSITGEGPYINHGQAMFESTLTCIMARESAYSGIEVTWDMILNSKQDLQPKAFGYREKYEVTPLPVPGIYQFR